MSNITTIITDTATIINNINTSILEDDRAELINWGTSFGPTVDFKIEVGAGKQHVRISALRYGEEEIGAMLVRLVQESSETKTIIIRHYEATKFNYVLNGEDKVATFEWRGYTSIPTETWLYSQMLTESAGTLANRLQASIFMGNPGDSNYVDTPVKGVYLGSTLSAMSVAINFWAVRNHDGRLLICKTSGGNDRSTAAHSVVVGSHFVNLGFAADSAIVAELNAIL